MKRIWIFLILLAAFAITGCSRDRNPLEDEQAPDTPVVKTPAINEGMIILSWQPCAGAVGYKIYKNQEIDGKYVPEGTFSSPNTEFKDNKVAQGDKYQYIVAAITAGGLEGYDSDPVTVVYDYKPPVEPPVTEISISGIVVDSRKDTRIGDAEVTLDGKTQSTNSAGEFTFTVPKYGNFTLLASKDGYISEVTSEKSEPVQIRLRPIPKLKGTIRGDFDEPTYIAFSKAGDRAYVTNFRGNSVTVINTFSDTVVVVFPVGDGPIGIAANPAKDKVYVASKWSESVSVIDTKSNKVEDITGVGKSPTHLIVSPDGNWLYSVNSMGNDISVIDTNQQRVTDHIPVGEEPYGIAITPDGAYLYVTNKKEGTVSVVDTKLKRQTNEIGVGQDPTDIIVSPDGQRVYVSADKLMVIDVATSKVEPQAVANPRGLVIVEEVVYVVARMDNKVELLDVKRNAMVGQTIDVGMRPVGVATNGKKIYVANSIIDNTVSVLEFP